MNRKSFTSGKAYYYFLLTCILLSGILSFYLSCKSKSPTEATSALHNQVASQSTNNTTTSSSTTTSVRPGNTPTNTTTLITSRTLTSTSTSTSSTSTTSTSTTTSRQPTTSTTTSTPLAECDIRWPRKPAQPRGYVLINGTRYYHGDTLNINSGDTITVSATACNYGSVTWNGFAVIEISYWYGNNGVSSQQFFQPFPPGGSSSCHTMIYVFPIPIMQNGILKIRFLGYGSNINCNSDNIIINIQIIE